MVRRRPGPTPESRARAKRISDALSGLLDDSLATATTDDDANVESAPGHPYRAGPAIPKPTAQGRAGLSCPGCAGPMTLENERGVQVHRCVQCEGMWLDPGELLTLVRDTKQLRQANPASLRSSIRELVQEREVVYRKCPRCSDPMNRTNYGGSSGVIIDRCSKHGLFLDPGEFEAIERFIQLGGRKLEEQRQKGRARLGEARDAAAAAAQSAAEASRYRRGYGYASGWFSLFGWFD